MFSPCAFPALAACGTMLLLTACASSPDESTQWRHAVVQQVSAEDTVATDMDRRCLDQSDRKAGEGVVVVRYWGIRAHHLQAMPADPGMSLQPGEHVLVHPGLCLLRRDR